MVWECGTEKKSIFIKNNEKICDENLSIQKSFGYYYTVFKLKGSKCFSTKDIDKVTISNFGLSRSPFCLYDQNEAALIHMI